MQRRIMTRMRMKTKGGVTGMSLTVGCDTRAGATTMATGRALEGRPDGKAGHGGWYSEAMGQVGETRVQDQERAAILPLPGLGLAQGTGTHSARGRRLGERGARAAGAHHAVSFVAAEIALA